MYIFDCRIFIAYFRIVSYISLHKIQVKTHKIQVQTHNILVQTPSIQVQAPKIQVKISKIQDPKQIGGWGE